MQCKSCGGQLVMQETYAYPIDENGVYELDEERADRESEVVCQDCGAGHAYDEIHNAGDRVTIALTVNSDPQPRVEVVISWERGIINGLGASQLLGILAVDEDHREIGRFLATPPSSPTSVALWERVKELEALIPKGEHQVSFAPEGEDND